MTPICVGKLTIIGSDNGLSPERRQAIIWTNAGILLIGPLWTNFSEILIEILTFSFKKMRLKVSCAKWQPFCLGLNVLNRHDTTEGAFFVSTIYQSSCTQTGKWKPGSFVHIGCILLLISPKTDSSTKWLTLCRWDGFSQEIVCWFTFHQGSFFNSSHPNAA